MYLARARVRARARARVKVRARARARVTMYSSWTLMASRCHTAASRSHHAPGEMRGDIGDAGRCREM